MWKTALAVLAAALVATGGAAAALYLYSRPTVLRVAVVQGAEDYRLLSAAAHIFSHQRESIRLHLVPVPNAAASANALESRSVDLAVVRGDVAITPSVQTLLILHRNALLLMAPGGSRVKRIGDLRGKRVGVVGESLGAEANSHLLEVILAQYDIPASSVSAVPIGAQEVRSSLEARKVDAIFAAAAPQSDVIEQIVGSIAGIGGKAPIFIPINEARALAKRFPALEPLELLQGAFGGDPPRPSAAIESSSVSVLLAARSSLEDAIAGEITRLFFTYRGAMAAAAPLANAIEAPSTEKGATLPVHQGAADYLDGNERSFFDKYSDFIYIGAMMLSLIGSGAAALASRLNLRSHEQTEHLTERLLEILQAARCASCTQELDAYEREVDEILYLTMSDKKLRSVEPSGMHMMALALDQARRVIRDRRRQLSSDGVVLDFPSTRSIAAE